VGVRQGILRVLGKRDRTPLLSTQPRRVNDVPQYWERPMPGPHRRGGLRSKNKRSWGDSVVGGLMLAAYEVNVIVPAETRRAQAPHRTSWGMSKFGGTPKPDRVSR
jgi:hypothetical protein